MQHNFHHSVCFFLTQSDGHRSVGGGGCHLPPRDVTDDERTVPPCNRHEWGCYVYVLALPIKGHDRQHSGQMSQNIQN